MSSSVSRVRMMLRHAAASFAILCLLVLLVGCGAFQEQGTGQQGGGEELNTLRFNLQAEIPDLNSTTTTDSPNPDWVRTSRTPAAPSRADSSGKVTSVSTSSGARPGHSSRKRHWPRW